MTDVIAEFNTGRLLHDWDDPRVQGFVNGLDRVNRLAARSPGFIWLMSPERMASAQVGPPLNDPRVASTMSVWRSVDDLRTFVRDSLHGAFMRRSAEWFEAHDGPRYVIWPIAETHRPSVEEGLAKLQQLAKHGASADCFDFQWDEQNREPA